MPSLRHLRWCASVVLVVLSMVAGGVSARAQTAGDAFTVRGVGDAFTVRGVDVDVTAADPQTAKNQAMVEGQRKAFTMLLERLTAEADRARLPKADGAAYVVEVTVDQERGSSTRYLATLSVRFSGPAVRKLLQGAGVPFAEVRARPLVVVPVFTGADGRAMLWDDPNPWRAAWAGQPGNGLVALVVPTGDLGDVQSITAAQALAGDPAALTALSTRWRGADVLVAAAAAAGQNLDVTLKGSPGAPKPFSTLTYRPADGENAQALMARAVADVSRGLNTTVKQANMLDFEHAGTVSALVPLTGLADWMAVRDRLGRVTQVRRWELVSLSRAEAAVVLHVVGETEQVRAALARAGLTLALADGMWTLKPGTVAN